MRRRPLAAVGGSMLVLAAGLGGLAACAAIVGFPDRELGDGGPASGDAGDSGSAMDGSGDAAPLLEAGADAATDAADAADGQAGYPASFFAFDGGSCNDFPESEICDDFDHEPLLTPFWIIDGDTVDGTASLILQSGRPDGGNHVAELASGASATPIALWLEHDSPGMPVQRFGFDIFVQTAMTDEKVEIARFDELVTGQPTNELGIYLQGTTLTFEDENAPDAGYAAEGGISAQRWTRLEMTITFSDGGASATLDATVDHVTVLEPTALGAAWTQGGAHMNLGYPRALGSSAKKLDYDNFTYANVP